MSKAMSTTAEKALARQRESMSERLAGLDGKSVQRIRTKNKTFILPPDDEKVPRELTVVVLDWAYNYQYFTKPWTPDGDNEPPVCFAIGQTQRDMVPSQNSPDIQNDGNPCATCWANQFESASTGRGKACQNRIALACMLYSDEYGPEDGIFIISVSPTALKNWGKYSKALNERGYAPAQVVTAVSFDPNQAYDCLTFSADKALTKEYHDEGYFDEYVQHLEEATSIVLSEPKPKSEDDD